MVTIIDRRCGSRATGLGRRQHVRVPGRFNSACDAAYRVIREAEMSKPSEPRDDRR